MYHLHGGGAPAAVKVLDCCSDNRTSKRDHEYGHLGTSSSASLSPAFSPRRNRARRQARSHVKFAYDQAPENVDPFFNNVRIGVIIGQHVWDTLVYRDPNTGEYKGQLATGWRQVDDKTIEFDLRRA